MHEPDEGCQQVGDRRHHDQKHRAIANKAGEQHVDRQCQRGAPRQGGTQRSTTPNSKLTRWSSTSGRATSTQARNAAPAVRAIPSDEVAAVPAAAATEQHDAECQCQHDADPGVEERPADGFRRSHEFRVRDRTERRTHAATSTTAGTVKNGIRLSRHPSDRGGETHHGDDDPPGGLRHLAEPDGPQRQHDARDGNSPRGNSSEVEGGESVHEGLLSTDMLGESCDVIS